MLKFFVLWLSGSLLGFVVLLPIVYFFNLSSSISFPLGVLFGFVGVLFMIQKFDR